MGTVSSWKNATQKAQRRRETQVENRQTEQAQTQLGLGCEKQKKGWNGI